MKYSVIFLLCSLSLHSMIVGANNYCPTNRISRACTKGRGDRIFNSGKVWNPDKQVIVGVDEHWNCLPCCRDSGYALDHCQDMSQRGQGDVGRNSMSSFQPKPQSQGQRGQNQIGQNQFGGRNNREQNQFEGRNNRGQNQRGGNQRNFSFGRKKRSENDIRNADVETVDMILHCPMNSVSRNCTKGPGERIFNSGSVWDPDTEFIVGVDEHWNCIPCCIDSGYTLHQCQDNTQISEDDDVDDAATADEFDTV